MNIFRERKGNSLVESMVALGLVMVGLLGIVVLYTRSLSLNRDVVNRTIAAGLAAEGIEVVKNIVDTQIAERGRSGWPIGDDTFEVAWNATAYLPESGTSLRLNDATGNLYDYDPSGTATAFRRTVTASSRGTDDEEYVVRATVTWTERGSTRSLEVEDHFFNWRP